MSQDTNQERPTSPASTCSSLSDEDNGSNSSHEAVHEKFSHRILIVEDFDLTSTFLSNTLKYCRAAHCTCAKNGEDALKIISEKGVFDLILTDCMMVGIGGIEFIRKVRALETERKWNAQVIVAMSADESNSDAAMEAGSSLFLFKYEEPMARIFAVLDSIKTAVKEAVVTELVTEMMTRSRHTSEETDGRDRRSSI